MALLGLENKLLLGKRYYRNILFASIARPYSPLAQCWDQRPHHAWDLLLLAKVAPQRALSLRFNFQWESKPHIYDHCICGHCGTVYSQDSLYAIPVLLYCPSVGCIDSIPRLPVPRGTLYMIFQSIPYWHKQEVIELQQYIYQHHKSKKQKPTTTIK